MPDAPSFEVQPLLGSVGERFILPRRKSAAARALGSILVGFGGLLSFALLLLAAAAFLNADYRSAGLSTHLTHLTVGFVLMGVGLTLMGFGYFGVAGWTEVAITDARLIIVERAGPLQWTRRLALNRIQRLRVVRGFGPPDGSGIADSDLCVIAAELDAGKRRPLLIGYPQVVLSPLAQLIADRLNHLPEGQPRLMDMGTEHNGPTPQVDQIEKPSASPVRVEREADGVLITIPPRGWRGSSRAFLVFAVIWLSVCGVITAFALLGSLGQDSMFPIALILIVGVFDLIGVAALFVAIRIAYQRAMLLVSRSELRVVRRDLFGARTVVWPRGQLAGITAGPGTMEVNGQPVHELQIHLRGRSVVRLLTGRDPTELAWLATLLRQELAFDRVKSGTPPRE